VKSIIMSFKAIQTGFLIILFLQLLKQRAEFIAAKCAKYTKMKKAFWFYLVRVFRVVRG